MKKPDLIINESPSAGASALDEGINRNVETLYHKRQASAHMDQCEGPGTESVFEEGKEAA